MIVKDGGIWDWYGKHFSMRGGVSYHVDVSEDRFVIASEKGIVDAMPPELAVEVRVLGLRGWVEVASPEAELKAAKYVVGHFRGA